jgi:pimeloyl-ACP methyl ester carboxylesterase
VLRVHPEKTAKAVLMLHGYTACPKDFVQLADLFYERGYNVYVPREPHHGLKTIATANEVETDQLIGYADGSMDVVAGLGDQVGVLGMSGGGVLATWLAEHRTDVSHLLTLSPFYRPDSGQAPPFAIKPLIVLFGYHLLPDRGVGDTNFTLGGLAQYLRIGENLSDEPVNPELQSVGVVTSAEDEYIDLDLAQEVPQRVADANGLKLSKFQFEQGQGIPHNVVGSSSLGDLGPESWERYFSMYEG